MLLLAAGLALSLFVNLVLLTAVFLLRTHLMAAMKFMSSDDETPGDMPAISGRERTVLHV